LDAPVIYSVRPRHGVVVPVASYELPGRRSPSPKLKRSGELVPFELVEKVVVSAGPARPPAPAGFYERILERYPILLASTKQVLMGLLIFEIALLSYLIGRDSDSAVVVGAALLASALLYAAVRSALMDVEVARNYQVSPEQERRVWAIITKIAESHSHE